MKKRIISAAICLSMCLAAITGCAGEESSAAATGTVPPAATSSSEPGSVTEKPSETTDAPETTAPSGEETASPETTSSAPDAPEEASKLTPLVYEITTEDGVKVTLVPAMHTLKEDCVPLPAVITDALDEADLLAVECNVSNTLTNYALQLKQIKLMYYEDGDNIENHIDPEVCKNATEFANEFGTNLSLFKTSRPWVWVSLLENLVVTELGLSSDYGVDNLLTARAQEAGKEIYELESAEDQLNMFTGIPDKVMEALISGYTVQTKDQVIKEMESTFEAWCRGDSAYFEDGADIEKIKQKAEKMGSPMTEEEVSLLESYNKVMLFDRNIGMKDGIIKLMKSGKKNIVVSVGSSHFFTEKGILKLLEKEGYTVKKVSPAE